MHSLIPYLQGLEHSGCAQCRETAPGLPALPTPSPCTDKGTVWITFKAVWQRPWSNACSLSSRGGAGLLSLGIRPSGNTGTPTSPLCPGIPRPGCLAGPEEAGWQRELSGAGLMAILWDWAEAPRALGMETRSPFSLNETSCQSGPNRCLS